MPDINPGLLSKTLLSGGALHQFVINWSGDRGAEVRPLEQDYALSELLLIILCVQDIPITEQIEIVV